MKKSAILFMTLFLLLTACQLKNSYNVNDFLIVSEERKYHDLDEQNSFIVKKAINETEGKTLWEEFNIESEFPEIDFDASDIYFIGAYLPSSCPIQMDSIDFEKTKMIIEITSIYGDCTALANPQNFILKVGKDQSNQLTDVVINGEIITID